MALLPTQITGLNAASIRRNSGIANADDIKNLDYAAKQGYVYQPTAAPVAPKPTDPTPEPVDPLSDMAKKFGSSGGSFEDFIASANGQNTITADERNKVYGDLGISDLENKSFALPSESTESLYSLKYGEMGLQSIKDKINALNETINTRKGDLNKEIGNVNENPWLTESSRIGRQKRLQDLAGGDIQNLIDQYQNLSDLYNSGISEINNYVARSSQDFQNDASANQNKLNYLLKKAESQISDLQNQKSSKVYRYATDYFQSVSDRELSANGYTPIASPDQLKGLRESDILRIGSRIYKKPVVETPADYQFINSNDQTGVFDKTTGTYRPISGGSATGAGVVSTPNGEAYDIASYATDPTHEAKIQGIMNNMGQMKSTQDMDAYIQRVAPGSPVTGQMIASAAAKHGVSWEVMMAIMQQDSSFGTAGKGARTYNPGNVGNTDSGAEVNYKTWQAGVDAVAKNLAWRKQAGGASSSMSAAPASNPEADAWAKTISDGRAKISDVPKELKTQVVQSLDSLTGGQTTQAQENKTEAIRLIEEMISDPARKAATGASAFMSKIPATAAKAFAAKVERLSGLLTLDAIKQMRGLGALSDAEGRRLEFSMSILKDRYISENDYLEELKRVKETLNKSGIIDSTSSSSGTTSTGLKYKIEQ